MRAGEKKKGGYRARSEEIWMRDWERRSGDAKGCVEVRGCVCMGGIEEASDRISGLNLTAPVFFLGLSVAVGAWKGMVGLGNGSICAPCSLTSYITYHTRHNPSALHYIKKNTSTRPRRP